MNKIKIFLILCIILTSSVYIHAESSYAPGVLNTKPENNSENIPVETQLSVEFSHQMNKKTINKSSVTLYNEFGHEIPTTVIFDDLGFKMYIKPVNSLTFDTQYSLILSSYLIKDTNGKNLREDLKINFTTEKIAKLKGDQKVAPKIVSIYPPKDSEDVPTDGKVIVGFNKNIKASTINKYTFIVENMKGEKIDGIFKYSHKDKKVMFRPSILMEHSTVYRVSLNEGITDDYGNYIVNPFEWRFKILPPPDKTPPFISSTSPENQAFNVSINSDISVKFNEPLNPASVNTSNFKVRDVTKNMEIPIILSYSPIVSKVILNPQGGLKFDRTYKVYISKAVKDMSSNQMLYDYNFAFTMEKAGDIIRPEVTSSIPVKNSTGFPIDNKIQVFFSEPLDNTSISEKHIKLYSKTENKNNIADLLLMYNEKNQTIVIIPETKMSYDTDYILELKDIKDKEGNSLEKNYILNFRTQDPPDLEGPEVIATRPNHKSHNIFYDPEIKIEFNEPVNTKTISNSSVRLMNMTTNKQEFLSFDTRKKAVKTLICKPILKLAYLTNYKIILGAEIADVKGNPMNNPYEFTFITEKNPDVLPPKLLTSKPSKNQQFISINTTISLLFNEKLKKESINSYSIYLYEKDKMIECDISHIDEDNTVILKPQMLLNYDSSYKILITSNVKDLAGNPIEETSIFFTTQLPPDVVSPYVISTSPTEGGVGISVDSMITANFSEDVNPESLIDNFYITDGEKNIPGKINYSKLTRKVIFEPDTKLKFSQSYTAIVKQEVKDLTGNKMERDKIWNFKVEPAPDNIPPSVIYFEPAAGRKNVPVTTKIKVKFSEPMKESTINEYVVHFSTADRETALDGIVNYIHEENTLEFYPNKDLEHNKNYFFVLNNIVRDIAGNQMKTPLKFHFTTIKEPDHIRPTIVKVFPEDKRRNIPINSSIQIDFSESIDNESINKFTCFIKDIATDTIIDSLLKYDITKNRLVLTPNEHLRYFSQYLIVVSRIVRDEAGNNLKSTHMSKFTTESSPDNVPPQLVTSYPENKQINVRVNDKFYVQFSEKMFEDSLNVKNIYIQDEYNKIIPGSLEFEEDKNRINITPEYSLKYESNYSIIVNNVMDIAGNSVKSGIVIPFKTENLPDLEPPRIVKYSPANLEKNVSIEPKIFLYFSEPVEAEKVNNETVILETYDEKIATNIIYDIREGRVEIRPLIPLNHNTEYKVLISSAITDLSGNLLDRTYIWKFYTMPPPDRTKPQIVEIIPADGTKNVDPTEKITVQFSEKMENESINKYSFWIAKTEGIPVDFKIIHSGDKDRAVIVPDNPLDNGTYVLCITEGIMDLAGNILANPKKTFFTVGNDKEASTPVIVVTNPENNSINISRYINLSATFNVPVDKTTINEYTFVVNDGVSKIKGKFVYKPSLYRAVFRPEETLKPDTVYSVTLTSGIKSLEGINLPKRKVIIFRTASN